MAKIRNLDELRAWYGKDGEGLSDEDMLRGFARITEQDEHDLGMSLGYDPGAGGKNAKRAGASIDNYQAGLYGTGEAIAGGLGLKGPEKWLREGREQNEYQAGVASRRAHMLGAVDKFSDVHSASDLGDLALGGAIQSVPYGLELAAGALTGGVTVPETLGRMAVSRGVARTAGGFAAAYPSSTGDILQNQREQSGTTDLPTALGLAIPYDALNLAGGIEGTLVRGKMLRSGVKALDDMSGVKGALARSGTTALKTGLTEGATETGQEFMNQFGRMAVAPDETFFNPRSNEAFRESFGVGALLGIAASGPTGGMRSEQWHEARKKELADKRNAVDLLATPTSVPAPLGIDRQTGMDLGAEHEVGDHSMLGAAPAQQDPAAVAEAHGQLARARQFMVQAANQGDTAEFYKLQEIVARLEAEFPRLSANDQGAPARADTATADMFAADTAALPTGVAEATAARSAPAAPVTPATPASKVYTPDEQELMALNVPDHGTTAKSLHAEAKASGLPAEALEPMYAFMRERRYGHAKKALTRAIIAAKTGKPIAAPKAPAAPPVVPPILQPPVAAAPVAPAGVTAPAAPLVPGAGPGAQAVRVKAEPAQANKEQQSAAAAAPAVINAAGEIVLPPNPAPAPAPAPAPVAAPVAPAPVAAAPAAPVAAAPVTAPAEPAAPRRKVTLTPRAPGAAPAARAAPQGEGEGERVVQRKRTVTPAAPATAHVAPHQEEEASATAPAKEEADSRLSEEDALEIARATGRGHAADTVESEHSGTRVDNDEADASDPEADAKAEERLLAARFPDGSHEAERNRKVAKAYMLQMRHAPYGHKGKVASAIARQFGLDEGTLRKIGNPNALVKVGLELGMTEQQTRELLGVEDNTKAAAKKKGDTAEDAHARDRAESMADKGKSLALTEAGYDSEDAGMGGTDDSRLYKAGNAKEGIGDTANAMDEAKSNKILAYDEIAAKLLETAKKLDAAGDREAAAVVRADHAEVVAEQAQAMAEYATHVAAQAAKTSAKVAKDLKSRAGKTQEQLLAEDEAEQAEAEAKHEAEHGAPAPVDHEPKAVEEMPEGAEAEVKAEPAKAKPKAVKAKKAEKAAPAKPKAVEARTDGERAQAAWDKVAASIDGMPKWAELSHTAQTTFTEFGEDNWTRSDVVGFAQQAKLSFSKDVSGKGKSLRQRAADFFSGDAKVETYTRDSLTKELTEFVRRDSLGKDVIIVERAEDLRKEEEFAGLNDAEWKALGIGGAQAFVSHESGKTYMVASNLVKGKGRGVLMHEVGGHLGAQKQLSPEVFQRLAGRVTDWMLIGDGSVENRIAVAAIKRVQQGEAADVAAGLPQWSHEKVDNELVAYFIEEAVNNHGVDPTALGSIKSAGLREWVRSLYATFKNAVRKLRGINIEKLTAQDVVDLAYGYAHAATDSNESAQANRVEGRAESSDRFSHSRSLPPSVQAPVNSITRTIAGYTRRATNLTAFTNDLIERGVNAGLTGAKALQSIYQQRAALTGSIERQVDKIGQLYDKVPATHNGVSERGTGKGSVNEYIYDSTREGKWGFEPEWRTDKPAIDTRSKQRFDALSPQSQALVRAMFKHGDDMLKNKKDAVLTATNTEYAELIDAAGDDAAKVKRLEAAKAAQLKQFGALFGISAHKPYAPMKRYGNWVVVAQSAQYLAADATARAKLEGDSDHYHVSFAESEASALELERELDKQGHYGKISVRQKEENDNQMYGGALSALTELRKSVDAEVANAKTAGEERAAKRMRAIVSKLYLTSLAENSARKSEMKRRGVAGEIDMLRSFMTQGRADANFVATTKYADASLQAINRMRKQVREGTGANETERSEIFNELAKRHIGSLGHEPSAMVERVQRLTSFWYLVTSPAYYLQNMTQPFMLSLPYMAGRHNYLKASAALVQGYRDLLPMLKNQSLGDQINLDAAPPELRTMLKTLSDRGRIDISLESELGRFRIEGDKMLTKGWNKVDSGLRNAVQQVESINRLSTAVAAYRMELARTGDAAAATEYADEVISKTHGDYTRLNAPRLFNTNVGKVALQFRKFQLIQSSLLAKLVKNSFSGEERGAARKALAYTLAHTAVMSGAVGLPGYAALTWLYGALAGLFGDEDEPHDAEGTLREWIGDSDIATLLTRGVPAALGVDLSSKIGMGTVLSVLPYTDVKLDREGANAVVAGLAAGPFGGLLAKSWDGMGLIRSGDYYKGIEQIMPTGVSGAMRAYRTASDGITQRNGDVALSADEINFAHSIVTALGFQTTQVSERAVLNKSKFAHDEHFKERTAEVKHEYLRAHRDGDYEGLQNAREAWTKLQQVRRENGYKVEPQSTLLKAVQAQRKREHDTAGGVQFNKNNKRFVQSATAE